MKQNIIGWICLLAALLILSLFLFSCDGSADRDEQTVTWRNLTLGVGAPLPAAEDFASTPIPAGASVRFAREYTFPNVGEYEIDLILTDAKGHEECVSVKFHLVMDNTPPTLTGVTDRTVYLGDGISYRSGVTFSDNCDGEVTLTVDSSAVDLTTEGDYPVTYTATDACGNRTVITVRVYVYEESITEADLYRLLDPVIEERISKNISTEQQAKEIYYFVSTHVTYVAYSNKSDWVRAAYDGLRTGQGDCYTYFALSKAFFNRLGISTMDIHRTEGIVDERHYWNYVNIGTEQSPRWYHFDATPLRGDYHSGCLLTDAQIACYNRTRADENGVTGYFYAYDASEYPPSDTRVINDTLPSA